MVEHKGLSNWLKELKKCLDDLSTLKRNKRETLEEFYSNIRGRYGFDAVGVFRPYFEPYFERKIWVILDERKMGGIEAHVRYETGDAITLLDEQGIKIREPVTLDTTMPNSISLYPVCNYERPIDVPIIYGVLPDYYEMYAKLRIDPNVVQKYLVGLRRMNKEL